MTVDTTIKLIYWSTDNVCRTEISCRSCININSNELMRYCIKSWSRHAQSTNKLKSDTPCGGRYNYVVYLALAVGRAPQQKINDTEMWPGTPNNEPRALPAEAVNRSAGMRGCGQIYVVGRFKYNLIANMCAKNRLQGADYSSKDVQPWTTNRDHNLLFVENQLISSFHFCYCFVRVHWQMH